MLEHLYQVSAVDPSAAGLATNEVLGLVPRRIAKETADVFAARNIDHCRAVAGAGTTPNSPVFRSLTATFLPGF
jgi:hypothetical protein